MMKNVMVKAWEIANGAAAKLGGKANEYLSIALRMAWAELKSTKLAEKIIIVFNRDNNTFNVYGVRNGRTIRTRENLNKDDYREAYGYLFIEEGIKTSAIYEIANGVKTFKGVKAA